VVDKPKTQMAAKNVPDFPICHEMAFKGHKSREKSATNIGGKMLTVLQKFVDCWGKINNKVEKQCGFNNLSVKDSPIW
jgi:nitrate/TMAO reductase-like tetraheme cytochrome c subunit